MSGIKKGQYAILLEESLKKQTEDFNKAGLPIKLMLSFHKSSVAYKSDVVNPKTGKHATGDMECGVVTIHIDHTEHGRRRIAYKDILFQDDVHYNDEERWTSQLAVKVMIDSIGAFAYMSCIREEIVDWITPKVPATNG